MMYKRLAKINKELIVRYLIFSAVSILWIAAVIIRVSQANQTGQFSGGVSFDYTDLLEPILFVFGGFLLILNRKLTDYISFAIFIFLIGGVFSYEVSRCSDIIGFTDCFKALFLSNISWILLILISPLVFLIFSFIKNIGK
jgi:hypothetical protein